MAAELSRPPDPPCAGSAQRPAETTRRTEDEKKRGGRGDQITKRRRATPLNKYYWRSYITKSIASLRWPSASTTNALLAWYRFGRYSPSIDTQSSSAVSPLAPGWSKAT